MLFTIVFCECWMCVFLLHEIISSMGRESAWGGCSEASLPRTPAPFCVQPLFCFPLSRLGVGLGGGEGHALSRKCCQPQSPSPDENERRQPERTAPYGGLGRGSTLQSPKFPRSPHRAKAPFVQKVRSSWPAVGEFRCPAQASSPDVHVCTAEARL